MDRLSVEQYALAVCFVSVFAMALNIAAMAYAVVAIYAPALTMPSKDVEYRATMTNESFWRWMSSGDKQATRPTDESLARQRLESRREQLAAQSDSAKGQALKTMIYTLLFAALLIGHWRMAPRVRPAGLAA